MGYQNRRYRVVDGKLEKVWTGTNEPGWFMTKAEAWDAVKPAPVAIPRETWQPLPPETTAESAEDDATATTFDDDYETWNVPALRAKIKARTGKGPKVGAESTKVAMIERLRGLDDEGTEAEPVEAEQTEGDLAAAVAEGDVVI